MFKKITLEKFKLCVILELYEIAPYTKPNQNNIQGQAIPPNY